MNINQILRNTLSIDNHQRNKAEEQLFLYKQSQPDNFIKSIGECCTNQELLIRKIAIMHFRLFFFNGNNKIFDQQWPLLSEQTQDYIKNLIFILLQQETETLLKKWAKEIFKDLITDLWNRDNNYWPSLTLDVWKLFLSESNQTISVAYEILSILMAQNVDTFHECTYDLYILFQKGLIHEDSEINRQCFKAFTTFIENAEAKQLKQFKELIPTMLMCFLRLSQRHQKNKDFLEDIIDALNDAGECDPRFFTSNIHILINTIYELVANPQINPQQKSNAVIILVTIAERTPKVFKKEHQHLDKLIEMIYYVMIQISPIINEQWQKPVEGYFEDDDTNLDITLTKFGQNAIDRLVSSLGYNDILPYLSYKCEYLLQQEDWRKIYAALMTLSQIGEYAELDQVAPLIEKNLNFIHHNNPQIRYAILHMIGQLADDMKPQFQEELTELIMSEVLKRFQLEKVERVQAHLFAMLTNYWESTQISEQYFYPIFEYCLDKFKNGISLIKENAITCIASISEINTEFMNKQLSEFLPLIFQSIDLYKSNKKYEQLTGQIIECLTIIIITQSKHDEAPIYAQQTIQTLASFQLIPFKENLKITAYVLSGWQRLSLQSDLVLPFMDDLVQNAFMIIKNIMHEYEEASKQEMFAEEDDEEVEQIKTAAIDCLQIGQVLLNILIEQFNKSFLPYAEQCQEIIFKFFDQVCYKSIQQNASETLLSLITNLKQNTNLEIDQIAKYTYISKLIQLSTSQCDPEEENVYVRTIAKIIDIIDSDFLTQVEVQELIYFFIKTYQDSDNRMSNNKEFSDNEEAEEINEPEEKLQVESTEIIEALLKTHTEKILACQYLLTQIKLPAMNKNYELPVYQKQFTLFLIDNFIEYIGYPKLGSQFNQFVDILVFYSQDINSKIRQTAVYGIGLIAKMQKDVYLSLGNSQLNAIRSAIDTHSKVQGKKKEKQCCLDNVYAALGNIIYYQPESLGESFPLMVSIWLKALPLKYDKVESKTQSELLTQMIFGQIYQIITSSLEIAQQVFYVLSEILYNNETEDIFQQKIIQTLQQLIQVPFIQNFKDNLLIKVKNQNQFQMKALLNI